MLVFVFAAAKAKGVLNPHDGTVNSEPFQSRTSAGWNTNSGRGVAAAIGGSEVAKT